MAYHPRSLNTLGAAALALLAGCSTAPVNQVTNPPQTAATDATAPVLFSPFGLPEAPPTAGVPAAAAPAVPRLAPPQTTLRASARLDFPPPGRAFPPLPAVEIRDTLPVPRVIDLITPQDDLWDRIRYGFAMPNLTSPLVVDRQIWYASRPSDIKRIVERSRRYLYHIVHELEKRGMPTELALLPMVESAFNPMAYSSAHAAGLWQFIPSTGKSYNLQQNWWYDARRDIIASTNAALDYLQFLYGMHGDWHLALASYNWGENAVGRAIERNRAKGMPTDYLSLTMPQETRYYVPKLQALKNIIANPGGFNISLDAIPNEPYFVTVTIKDMDIRVAAKLAEMPIEELIALNPAHNRPVITHGDTLVLPADRAEIFQTNLENHDKPLVSWQRYTLQQGDKLDKLANHHGIALAKLKQANGIGATTKVGPGFQLLLPVKGMAGALEPLPALFTPPRQAAERQVQTRTVVRRSTHIVAKGETLASIADRYDISVDRLRQMNNIGRLAAGQKLTIERAVAVQSVAPAASSRRAPTAKAASKAVKPAARPAAKPGAARKAAPTKPDPKRKVRS